MKNLGSCSLRTGSLQGRKTESGEQRVNPATKRVGRGEPVDIGFDASFHPLGITLLNLRYWQIPYSLEFWLHCVYSQKE